MSGGIQLSGIVQPSPDMIFDETYEKGERILPKQEGRWTLFGVQPIFTKDDEADPIARNYAGGHETPSACQVTWLAADEVSYKITFTRYRDQQLAMQRQQAAQAAGPKLFVPTAG